MSIKEAIPSRIMKIIITIIFTFTFFQITAQTDDQRRQHFNVKKAIAIEGYDPVSYFNGQPQEGSASFKASFKGIIYQFASQANLDKFKANPSHYEPAYGGWCAYAMGENGDKVKIDPETYKIVEGRLYLFYNFWGNNTLDAWNKKEKELKNSGDKNWKKYLP